MSQNTAMDEISTPRPGDASGLNLDLIRKYAIPGPRYTSYPPATEFTNDLAKLGLDEAMAGDNAPGAGPISLYFHLPFCESLCWFCGCTKIITGRREAAAEYLDDLAREVQLTAAKMDCARPVEQVHFGGGTPTFFPPEELRRLGALITGNFRLAPGCEYSVEIDPRRLSEEHVVALAEIGANRASLGVQDTNPEVQRAVNRWQPMEVNRQAFAWLRAHGFKSINVDLIYGLPLQTPETFAQTVAEVLTLQPDRLSVFSYAHVPWIKPAQRIFDKRGQLPEAERKLVMGNLAHRLLKEAGYVDIGLDHFARADDELAVALRAGTLHRNFQGYSTRADASLYGFGISAISSTRDSYRQNHRDLGGWRAALGRGELPVHRGLRLSEEDLRRRTLIMRIMCNRGLDYARLSRELGVDVRERYAREIASLADLEADGVLRRADTGIEITVAGVALLRVVAMRFDQYLTHQPNRYSKTI